MINDDIIAAYRLHQTIKRTARELGISEQAVRKTLITAHAWTSPLAERIQHLHVDLGLPVKDIASMVDMSPSTVSSYLPYAKGSYLRPSKTRNAEAIRRCRARQIKS